MTEEIRQSILADPAPCREEAEPTSSQSHWTAHIENQGLGCFLSNEFHEISRVVHPTLIHDMMQNRKENNDVEGRQFPSETHR
jgi:hypothetical protein